MYGIKVDTTTIFCYLTTMKKLYIIRRQDWFPAWSQIPFEAILEAGSLWMIVSFTDAERAAYTFPISNYEQQNSRTMAIIRAERSLAGVVNGH